MGGRGRLLTVAGSLAALLAAAVLAFAASQPLIGALVLIGALAAMTRAIAAHRAGGAARAEAAAVGEAMASVASGDFTARPGLLSSEPLSALQAPFDAMAGSIAALFSQLSDQRSQLEAVLDTMADGVVVVDGEDRLSLANPAAQDLLGIGSASGERLSTAFRDHELQGLVTVCRRQHAQQRAELHLPSVRRTVSATATPLIPSPGTPEASVLLTLHDLTTLRQLETTRREFVANVSHELRSPLASVKAMVETLEGGAVSDEAVAADFLQRALREVDRMSAIVDDLLELSRIESGQSELRRETVSLAAVALGVRSTLESLSSSSGIQVEVSADVDRPVLGDEGKLRQVVSNLVDNALKFTPAGRPHRNLHPRERDRRRSPGRSARRWRRHLAGTPPPPLRALLQSGPLPTRQRAQASGWPSSSTSSSPTEARLGSKASWEPEAQSGSPYPSEHAS